MANIRVSFALFDSHVTSLRRLRVVPPSYAAAALGTLKNSPDAGLAELGRELQGLSPVTLRHLGRAMKHLGLVNAAWAPTTQLHQVVESDPTRLKDYLGDALKAAYPAAFSLDENSTRADLVSLFAGVTSSADVTRGAVNFLLDGCRSSGLAIPKGWLAPPTGAPRRRAAPSTPRGGELAAVGSGVVVPLPAPRPAVHGAPGLRRLANVQSALAEFSSPYADVPVDALAVVLRQLRPSLQRLHEALGELFVGEDAVS